VQRIGNVLAMSRMGAAGSIWAVVIRVAAID